MSSSKRREAITDANIRTSGIGRRSLRTIYNGTHAFGVYGAAAGYGGTVTFPAAFQGTPNIMLTETAGSSAFGRTISLRLQTVQSSQFSYKGSPSHGTFNWLAIGSQQT